MIVLLAIAGISVLIAIVSGLLAIVRTWVYCMAVRDSTKFLPYVFKQTSGEKTAIIGIVILCIPVWIVLSIIIGIKKLKQR